MRPLVLTPIVSLLVVVGAGAALAGQEPDLRALAKTLAAQGAAWDKAIIEKRADAVAANMADDFRQIDGAGTVVSKQEFLADILSPDLTIHPYTVEDFDVRIYGDVALLSGTTQMTGEYKGKPFQSHYRYIDIYVRRGGAWKVVSVQITKFPQ